MLQGSPLKEPISREVGMQKGDAGRHLCNARAPLHIEKSAYGVVQLRGLLGIVGITTNLSKNVFSR